MSKTEKFNDYKLGLRRGIPIGLGYVSVSFTFGLLAVNGGIPLWLAVFISLSNLTGAGQFAAASLMINGTTYMEIALTTLIINLRYTLMSISLSQKIDQKTSTIKRLILGYGITDEIFTVASIEPLVLSFYYMIGLITLPLAGWVGGTFLGGLICSSMPVWLSSAMGIAIYGMFIAIIVPQMKGSRPVLYIVLLSIVINLFLYYIPFFNFISSGFRVIITALIASAVGALVYPQREEVC